MWREGIAALSITIIALLVLYPILSQDIQQVGGPETPDSGIPVNSASSTVTSPPTTSSDYVAPIQFTTTATANSQAFDSGWISQFISAVDVARGGNSLAPCPRLDSFAMLRFKTLNTGNNWEIIHYGYSEDLQHSYGGTAGSYAEEYFYPVTPSYRSPSGFAQYVHTSAPGHWGDLVNPLYSYYGVYTGTGPILLFPRNCTPSEFTAGVNQTQLPSGCHYQKVSGPWLVVELADTCA